MAQTHTVAKDETLNGIANTYGFKDYKEAGITGYGTNPNLIKPGQILTIGATKAATVPTSPTEVKDLKTADSYINAGQSTDFNNASKATEPPIRTSASNYQDLYDSISKSLTSDLPTKPKAPSLVDTYTNLRSTYGITDMETNLNDLRKQARDIQALNQVQFDAETGKPVAMNVIEGRVSEEQKQNNQKLKSINDSISTITDSLTQKYGVIDSLIKYTGMDYENATNEYDKKFTQNLSLMNTVKGIVDTEQSREDQRKDDARANLQIIYNNLNTGGASVSTLSPDEKTTITKLELQAGLPQGFYSSIVSKNPKSDILSTTTRDANGTKYADVILRNADGSLSTKTITLGNVSSSNAGDKKSETFSVINKIIAQNVTPDKKPYIDTDGYFTPEGFKLLVNNAVEDGINRGDFLAQYGSYLDPENAGAYGLTAKEKADLGVF